MQSDHAPSVWAGAASPSPSHSVKQNVTWQGILLPLMCAGGGSSVPVPQKMGPILSSPNLKNKILIFWGKSAFGSIVSTSPQGKEEL